MAGIDTNSKLVLHSNGSDTSTSFPDSSPFTHTVTANGDAQVDTAQSVFGGASGLFDGGSDWLAIPDSTDWDFGTNDMAIDFRIRFNSLGGNQCFVGRPTSGVSYFYFAREGSNIRLRDYNSGEVINIIFGAPSLSTDTWYHFALTRSGSSFRFFIDGVQFGSTATVGASFLNRSDDLQIGANSVIGYYVNGWMDEVRISNGDSRWTANFTPPSAEYSVGVDEILTEDLEITDSIIITDTTIAQSDTLNIADSILVIDTSVMESDTLNIADSIIVNDTTLTESDNIQISDSIIVTDTNSDAKFAYKILSINPLIFVTNTSPLEIVKVDTTDPINPTWEVKSVSGVDSAKDVALNSAGTYMYIAAETGQVVKIEVADLSNQSIIDVNDTDDILTIEHNEAFGITYAGTDNVVGELYLIDERDTFEIDSDFTCLAPINFRLESNFNIVSAFEMDSTFTALSYSYFNIASDFKCLSKQTVPVVTVNDITPIDLQDCIVLIDDVALEDTDLVLSSVIIKHSVGEESNATFQLTRKHDKLDTTLEGVSSVITNQNTVKITCKGVTLFPYNNVGTGRISELDCQYQDDTEFVGVTAFADEATNKVNGVTMSLPGLTSRLSLYDVLLQNPLISNPYVDPTNEDNPKKYKGIKVDLGTIIEQHVSNGRISDTGIFNLGNPEGTIAGGIASAISNGTFNPTPNWTYFWGAVVYKAGIVPLGETIGQEFLYIGTSLSPVSEDLWQLINAPYFKQRIYDDTETGTIVLADASPGSVVTTREEIETEQGIDSSRQKNYVYKTYYYVGEAPFKEISARNGKKITKPRYADEPSLLVSIKDASHDHILFAKEVADLEYEQLKNINGDILPDTSCAFGLTLDSYLYYDIGLLSRINVDNTSTADIYNKNNGFPVSAKTITISLNDRKVSIDADNIKSEAELEIINSAYPDEDANEYNEIASKVSIYGKSNMRTLKEIE